MIRLATVRDALLPAFARTIRPPSAGDLNHILIFQPDHLGDIVLSEPAVRLLRERLPEARLTAVVGPWSARIARLAWPVDDVVEVDFPGFNRIAGRASFSAPYRQIERDALRLRELGAGRAVILRDDAWWAAALARASVSGDVIAAADRRNQPFATRTVDLDSRPHRSQRALALAAELLGLWGDSVPVGTRWDMSPRMSADEWQVEAGRALLLQQGIEGPYIAQHPGAGAAVKTWPEGNWRAVVRAFPDIRFVLTGSEAEATTCERIASGLPNAVSIAGATTLDSLIGVLAGARLAVGTDNGPMHVAAALGTPTVRLYGPSNPAIYGPPPGASGHHVVSAGWRCPRCEDLSPTRPVCGCMTAITVPAVVMAIQEALADAA